MEIMEIGNWVLYPNGKLIYNDETMKNYTIMPSALKQKDWLSHIYAKQRDFNSFVIAYFTALQRLGIKEINVLVPIMETEKKPLD